MSGTFEGRVQLDAHTRTRPLVGMGIDVQCPGSFRLVTDIAAARLFKIERAKTRAIAAARDAIGEVLIEQFPEAESGDESPAAVMSLRDAVHRVVEAWVSSNVPKPLTLREAVAALVTARNALADALPERSGQRADVGGALSVVQDALNRSRMSDDDLPRP